jgi:hypothetical protein
LWAIPSFILTGVAESKQFIWFLISIVPLIGFGIVSIYLGWQMVFKKADILDPFESLAIKVTKKIRGKQAAKNLIAEYSKPGRKMMIGGLNIFSGLLYFISTVVGIIVVLRTL